MRQIHLLIGGGAAIGDPVNLFANISTGVQDFFYEPMVGIVHKK